METSRSLMADSTRSSGSLAGGILSEGCSGLVIDDAEGRALAAPGPELRHPTSFTCLSNTERSFPTSARSRATSSAMAWEGGCALSQASAGSVPEHSQTAARTDYLTLPNTLIRFPSLYASLARRLTHRRALKVNPRGQGSTRTHSRPSPFALGAAQSSARRGSITR